MKKLTVKEIAKMADVSVTAVSFVLNDKPGISDETREKVKQIIEETGFVPNRSSRNLVKNKSYNISLMINSKSSPFHDLFYFEITRGILDRSRKYGYNIIISRPVDDRTDLPDSVYSGDTDGLIFMQDVGEELMDKAMQVGIPFVVADSHSSKKGITSILPDYFGAAYTAATYLIRNGHRKIAMISYDAVPDFHKQTRLGFLKAMEENGITPDPVLTSVCAKDEKSGYEAAKRIFSDPKNRPTALFSTVDIIMIGAVQCAKDMGISIPDEVSFIGIDDILLSRYVEPPLTTIGINKEEIGALAMDLLYRKIRGKDVENVLLPMELVERKSVKKIN